MGGPKNVDGTAATSETVESVDVAKDTTYAGVFGDGAWSNDGHVVVHDDGSWEELEQPIVKADIIEIEEAKSTATPKEKKQFGGVGEDVVPYPLPPDISDPQVFVDTWMKSPILQPPIDAYASDIGGLGYSFVPTMDLGAEDAEDVVREAEELYRYWLQEYKGVEEKDLPKQMTDDEVKERVEQLRHEAQRERLRAEMFFKSAVRETSFTKLRRNTRQEAEIGGNWYWEIVRGKSGKPLRIKGVPFQSVRALKEDKVATEVETKIQVTPIHWDTVKEKVRFRRWVQKTGWDDYVYFKAFGDPRTVSDRTGRYYRDENALKREEPDAEPATELMHGKAMYVPGSVYGLPRWLGAWTYILGEESAADYNLNFFSQNTIPTGMLLVSGGQLVGKMDEKIKEFLSHNVKGTRGPHKMMILQAVGKGGNPLERSQNVKLEWVPMTSTRQSDGQFLSYSEFADEKTDRQFRLPGMLTGKRKQLNRATAYAELKFAEERVYQPLRADDDETVNSTLMPAIDIKLWKFKTNSPETRDPVALTNILDKLVKNAVLSTDEAREIASEILSKPVRPFNADWSKIPYQVLKLGEGAEDETEEREELADEVVDVSADEYDEARAGEDRGGEGDVET